MKHRNRGNEPQAVPKPQLYFTGKVLEICQLVPLLSLPSLFESYVRLDEPSRTVSISLPWQTHIWQAWTHVCFIHPEMQNCFHRLVFLITTIATTNAHLHQKSHIFQPQTLTNNSLPLRRAPFVGTHIGQHLQQCQAPALRTLGMLSGILKEVHPLTTKTFDWESTQLSLCIPTIIWLSLIADVSHQRNTAQVLLRKEAALQAPESAITVASPRRGSGFEAKIKSGCVTAADSFGEKMGILDQKNYGTVRCSEGLPEREESIPHLKIKRRSQSRRKVLAKRLPATWMGRKWWSVENDCHRFRSRRTLPQTVDMTPWMIIVPQTSGWMEATACTHRERLGVVHQSLTWFMWNHCFRQSLSCSRRILLQRRDDSRTSLRDKMLMV